VCAEEDVSFTNDGLEAMIFNAEGDMRNALNNLQAAVSGFGHVNQDNVFKVCDQPHPVTVKAILQHGIDGQTNEAVDIMKALWNTGYSCTDIIGTVFKVAKASDMNEPSIYRERTMTFIHLGHHIHRHVQRSVKLSATVNNI